MMNSQIFLVVELVVGIIYFRTVAAYLEDFPEVTYEDIEQLNATCPFKDSCTVERYNEYLDYYNCNCDKFCSQYDTCCVDSIHRYKVRVISKPYSCAKPYRSKTPYFMIDRCDPSWFGINHTKEMCSANVEDLEDLFLAVPVTNKETEVTYRNYYCAVCNNETDKGKLTFWILSLRSGPRDIMTLPLSALHFLSDRGVWVIGYQTGDLWEVIVQISVIVPTEIEDNVHQCVNNVISRCAGDWNDTVVEYKCSAYMAIVRVCNPSGDMKLYRNPHCAVCNHESFNNLRQNFCSRIKQPIVSSNTFFVRLFSLYDKKNNCNDNEVFDTISRKCRKVFKG